MVTKILLRAGFTDKKNILKDLRNIDSYFYQLNLKRITKLFAKRKEIKAKKIRKVLVIINPPGLGDVVVTTPVVTAIKNTYQDVVIDVLMGEGAAEVMYANPNVRNVFALNMGWTIKERIYESTAEKMVVQKHSFLTLSRIIFSIKKKKYDMVIDLDGTVQSALITWLSGATVRCGYHRNDTEHFYTHGKVDERYRRNDMNMVEHHLQLIEAVGIKSEERDLKLFATEEDIVAARALIFKESGENPSILIGINPVARKQSREWFYERFIELALRLKKGYGARIVLFGAREHEAVVADMVSKIPDAINLAGKTTIGILFAVMSMCDLVITVNTGAMHVAAATGVPMITIEGASSALWAAWTPNNKIVRTPFPCAPCERNQCQNAADPHGCMNAVHVDNVMEAVKSIFRNSDKITAKLCL